MEHYRKFNVLLIESNPELVKMIAFALESQFEINVIEAEDSGSAIECTRAMSDIQLVIIGDIGKQAAAFTHFLNQDVADPIQVIACVEQKLDDPMVILNAAMLGIARKTNLTEDLAAMIREKFFKGEVATPLAHEFSRIRPQILVFSAPLACDVFIRLSEVKYLKRFRKGDQVTAADIEKYWKDRHVDYFYVPSGDVAPLARTFNERIEVMLRSEHIEAATLRALSLGIHETVCGIVRKDGVTDAVREMTQTSVKLVIKSVGTAPQLNNVFERINREMGHYIVSHSLAVAEVACVLASHLSYSSELTFQKLTLAALFHDLALNGNELARANTLKEVQADPSLLLLDTLEDFKNHPRKSGELVNLLHNVPADVDAIILQHHERPDGSGFPVGISGQQFSPLSSIFILAHDFVSFVLEAEPTVEGKQLGFSEFLGMNRLKYPVGTFKQIVRSLENKLVEGR